MRITMTRMAVTIAGLATIGCDRVTKHAATLMLAGGPDRSYLANTVRFGYVENVGGFLSLGASWPSLARTTLFTVVTGVLLLILAFVAVRRRRDEWSTLGISLFVAGGASNWVDRIAHGRVVDFVTVGVGPVRTGVFNVADTAILFGALLFIWAEFRHDPNEPTPPASDGGLT